MSSSTDNEPNAALYVYITPGSELLQTLQDYLRSEGAHTRQLTDTEQAWTDRLSRDPLLKFIGADFKRSSLGQLDRRWPDRSDVHDSIFKTIANHDETQIKDTAITFKIKYQHPDDSGTGTNTILRLTAPWQYVEPSTESCLQEPNATLRIYVHPGRQEFILFQGTLQKQGFSFPPQENQTAISAAQISNRDRAAYEVHCDVDMTLSKTWDDLQDQLEIKRDIYHRIASSTEADNQADDKTNEIEIGYYHPSGEDTTLDLSRAAIAIRAD